MSQLKSSNGEVNVNFFFSSSSFSLSLSYYYIIVPLFLEVAVFAESWGATCVRWVEAVVVDWADVFASSDCGLIVCVCDMTSVEGKEEQKKWQ